MLYGIACTCKHLHYVSPLCTMPINFPTNSSVSINAGLALWDCVVVHVLAGQTDRHVSLLTAYNSLSLPVHAVYLFLLLLVTVSLSDRCVAWRGGGGLNYFPRGEGLWKLSHLLVTAGVHVLLVAVCRCEIVFVLFRVISVPSYAPVTCL